jgi:hypothetical protein
LFLSINSVADHHDEKTAMQGSFNDTRMDALSKCLSNYSSDDDYPLRIAVLHHHPILHSCPGFTPSDVLPNGDRLMDLLSEHRFNLLIHGHRHQPRLKRYQSHGNNMIVFASGSFSAMLKEDLSTVTRNLFHWITLSKESEIVDIVGEIASWEFNRVTGWIQSGIKSAGIPHKVRFKKPCVMITPDQVNDTLKIMDLKKLDSDQIFKSFPDLKYYLPDEIETLKKNLDRGGFRLKTDDIGDIIELGRMTRVY